MASSLEEVDDAIYKALASEQNLTYNKLLVATNSIKKCSRQTFDVHLKKMVKDRLIFKNPINGGKVEYSINNELFEPPLKIINEDREVLKELKKNTEFEEIILEIIDKDKAIWSTKYNETFDHFTSKIEELLERENEILFFIESGRYGKMWEDRLEKMRLEYSNVIKRTVSYLRNHYPKLGDDVCTYLFYKRFS